MKRLFLLTALAGCSPGGPAPSACPPSAVSAADWDAALAALGARTHAGTLDSGAGVDVTVSLAAVEGACPGDVLPVVVDLASADGSYAGAVEAEAELTQFDGGGFDLYVRADLPLDAFGERSAEALAAEIETDEGVEGLELLVVWGVRDADLWGALSGVITGTDGAHIWRRLHALLWYGSPLE